MGKKRCPTKSPSTLKRTAAGRAAHRAAKIVERNPPEDSEHDDDEMDPPVSHEPATTEVQPAQPATHNREQALRRRLDELVGAVEPKLSRTQRKAKARAAEAASRAIAEDYAQQPPDQPAAFAADTTLPAGTSSSSSQPAPAPPSATLPAFSDADLALLRHDFASDVSLFDLDSLNPVQLAVAALRPDLDSLVQRRAYHEFLQRRDEYEQGFGADVPERASSIFSVPLNFPIPADISTLGPAYLLLVSFNPLCLSGAEATAATARFFELARQARAGTAAELPPTFACAPRPRVDTALGTAAQPPAEPVGGDAAPPPPEPPLAEVAMDRCVVSCRGVGCTPQTSLVLRVGQDGLAVVSSTGKHLFAIEPAKVRDFAYYPSVPAEGNDLTASAPTIVLDLKRVLVPAGIV
ncbi:hypothetical protein JCM9279_007267 [Rhodotorula babjevae]